MFAAHDKQLHWSQRIALVRHNLHCARQNGDNTFFKVLQAHAFVEGTDYVAILTTSLGDDADSVLNSLDNLNVGIAYVFQEAFKNVYESMREMTFGRNCDKQEATLIAQIKVDTATQIQRADFAIDRIVNSAIALIQLQPCEHQNDVACAWVLGATIIADAVSVAMHELHNIESCLGDCVRLENSWTNVQHSVESAVTALRGILNLMATDDTIEGSRRDSSSSSQGAMNMLRKISSAFGTSFQMSQPPPPYRNHRTASAASGTQSSRVSSISSQTSPLAMRSSFAHSAPNKASKPSRRSISPNSSFVASFAPLASIPATPGLVNEAFNFDLPPSPRTEDGENTDNSVAPNHYVRPKIEMIDPLQVSA